MNGLNPKAVSRQCMTLYKNLLTGLGCVWVLLGSAHAQSSPGGTKITLYSATTGEPTGTAIPFPGFSGTINVVSNDYNNDGVADIIASASFAGGPAIAILDSRTGEVMESFIAHNSSFTGSVSVTVQDVNGDDILDILASAGPSSEDHVFDGAKLNILRAFSTDDPFSLGGSTASADINNDGFLDLVTGAAPGSAPLVKVYDGLTGAIISQWHAYPESFTGGVYVAMGDIGNDGSCALVTGAGPTGAPVVAVWNPNTGASLSQFMAYAEDSTGGVRVAVNDGNGDGIADLITAAGSGDSPRVKVFSFPALDLLFSFDRRVFGPATQAVLWRTAAGSVSGAAFTIQPIITIKDATGNTVTSSAAAITMTVSSGATTVGTTTVNAVSGVATFNNTGISGTAGTTYTLTFASTDLAVVTQSITPTAAASAATIWKQYYFSADANDELIAGDHADPDKDGVENLLERALGLDPNSASIDGLPSISWTEINGEKYLTLTVTKSSAASDLNFDVEVNGDLSTWYSGDTHTKFLENTSTLLRVRDRTPLSNAAKRFIRLKVTSSP